MIGSRIRRIPLTNGRMAREGLPTSPPPAALTQLPSLQLPDEIQLIIPSKAIPKGGGNTDEPIRTRGWIHWHHLLTPRPLLIIKVLAEQSGALSNGREKTAANLLGAI